MIRDWWMAHRFELLVSVCEAGAIIVALVIYWFWIRRRKTDGR